MRIRILAQGFDLTPAIDEAVHAHFGLALHRFAGEVDTIDVFLKDINGPRGGLDKLVTAKVHLYGCSSFSVECTRSSLYAAIALCSRRCKRRVRRTLDKMNRVEPARLRLYRHSGTLPDVGLS